VIVRVVENRFLLIPEHDNDKFLLVIMSDFGISFKKHGSNKFIVYEMIP
jgi:hypothetical protein